MKINYTAVTVARAAAVLSVGDMLQKAGIPRATWQSVVRSRRASAQTIGKIARALGVDVAELIEVDPVKVS